MSSVSPFAPITRDDAARTMKKTVRTLDNWCDETVMPRPVSIGGSRYWHPDVFYGWLDAKLRGEPWAGEPALYAAAKTVTPFQPLTREDAVGIMGKSVRTLENWYGVGEMPEPVAIGRELYWHPEIFYGWLDARLKGLSWPALGTAPMEAPAGSGAVADAQQHTTGPHQHDPGEVLRRPRPKGPNKFDGRTLSARARARNSALLDVLNTPN